MNAFTLLKQDHEKVAGILEEIDETTERAVKGREELFTLLKQELDLHAMIEEEIFVPPCGFQQPPRRARCRWRATPSN